MYIYKVLIKYYDEDIGLHSSHTEEIRADNDEDLDFQMQWKLGVHQDYVVLDKVVNLQDRRWER